jgi:dolichyl-phosphate-mannose--protein O-mannosyl transferase
VKDENLFHWVCGFTALYVCYMVAILQIERVMYIYHYLVPLTFGALNLAMVFTYIFRDEVLENNRHTMINLGVFVLLVIGVFAFFSPFTYGFQMTEDEFALRNWFSFWQLNVVR